MAGGIGVAVGCGVAVGRGVASGCGVAFGAGVAVGCGVGAGAGVAVGCGVATGCGVHAYLHLVLGQPTAAGHHRQRGKRSQGNDRDNADSARNSL
ncbi:MAG: hypothetical protein QF554_14095 [Dehalococcoidia bacterium]|nr:hypothetical protein [Dehalococcoidia bacterium]